MSSPELQKNILATIAYYDGMDYPLTAFEIWKYLINFNPQPKTYNPQPFSLADVIKELDDYSIKRFIEKDHGFYFLRGRRELVDQRIKRNKISVGKIKKLRRIVWLLRFVPFIRMIGVTGALAMKNADADSDWDVLVVLKKGRIWTGRTLVTGFLHLIGKRRYGEKIKNRICLNHFIADDSLEVATKEKFPEFSSHEFYFILPVFDTGIFQKFQLQNSWIKDYKPNFYLREVGKIGEIGVARAIREIGEIILGWDFLENWLGKWQREKIMKNPLTKKPESFIRATDEYLIFLPEPHGSKLIEHLKQKTEMMAF